MHQFEEDIAAINGHITVIAAAAEDQSSMLAEISSTVNALDQVQQNATMVEETTAAAFALANEAEVFNVQVGHFSIAGGATGAENIGNVPHSPPTRNVLVEKLRRAEWRVQ